MADTITLSAGTADGAVVATDDAGAAGHVQIVKLAVSADGSATAIGADNTNGLDVDVTRVSGNVTVVQATATNLKVDASSVAVPVTDNGATLSAASWNTAQLLALRPAGGGGGGGAPAFRLALLGVGR